MKIIKNTLVAIALICAVAGFSNQAMAALDENGQYIPGSPLVEGDPYHVDCYGTGAYWRVDYDGGGEPDSAECDTRNDFIVGHSDNGGMTVQIHDFQSNLPSMCPQGQTCAYYDYSDIYTNGLQPVLTELQWQQILNPFLLDPEVGLGLAVRVVQWFAALMGVVAIIAMSKVGIKLIKKAFPNAY